MESDGDHIHYMVELEPNMSISRAISLMKCYTTIGSGKDSLQS